MFFALCSLLAAQKPNIIVFFTDDHGYGDLGCQGVMKDVKTPHIDALAKSGVLMSSGYVTAPQCSPSRCGLISGQYQNQNSVENNGSWEEVPGLKERFFKIKTLPTRLKGAGYVTSMAGKSHLGTDDSAELVDLGFDKVFSKHSNGPGHWNMDLAGKDIPSQEQRSREYHLETITNFACTFIERYKKEPFFFYLAYRAPHPPMDATQKYLDRFPGPMPESRRKALAAISAIDDGVGKVMETLQKSGLEEKTLIFLISDNGASVGLTTPETRADGQHWSGSLNDPMNGGKGMLMEGGIRTPFVLSWKGTIPGGQIYAQPVISLDVAATANALAGLPHDPTLDGVNLVPYLTGLNTGRPHDALFWRWNGQCAIRKGDMKYLTSGDRHYLFDLVSDPGERNNLYTQQPKLARDLHAELEEWSQGMIPPGIGPAEMERSARRYYDFYLDGKGAAGTEADDASRVTPKSKARARKKATAKADGADK